MGQFVRCLWVSLCVVCSPVVALFVGPACALFVGPVVALFVALLLRCLWFRIIHNICIVSGFYPKTDITNTSGLS